MGSWDKALVVAVALVVIGYACLVGAVFWLATPHEQRTMSTSPRLRCCLFYRVGVKFLIAAHGGCC